MAVISLQRIFALLWFHLVNQIRRIFATYVFPLLIIAVGVLLLVLYYRDNKLLQVTFDENVYVNDQCYHSADVSIKNHTVEVAVTKWSDLLEMDLSMATSAGQEDEPWEVSDVTKRVCYFSGSNWIENPFGNFRDSRYVFSGIDTFSFSVFLFYCICLSELYQDKLRNTEELLWSLGVSPTESMISWYLSVIAQSMIWSAINFVQVSPQLLHMASNVFLLWFSFSLVFFVTAIFALISAKFVRGTLTYLLAIFQMLLIWLFLFIWSQPTFNLPLPSAKALRLIALLHPVTQARNVFVLIQAAEFSKIGLHFNSLASTFNMKGNVFFGNALETLLVMILFSVCASALFLVNFSSLARAFKKLITKPSGVAHAAGDVFQEEMKTERSPIVEVEHLSMCYPNGFQAVTDVSFSIHSGEIVGLLGKNGAGKSTTMNVISGFYGATDGSVKVCGIDLNKDRNGALSKLSFCPQDDRFFYRLTIEQHLKLVCLLKGAKFDQERSRKLLDSLGLADKASQKPRNVSGGQKRKVCIAMAYIANTPLIILDEPTSAVDAATRKTLWNFFQSRQRENPEQAVILCTHFMQEADVLSQRIAIMSDGFLRAIGSSTYLKSLFGVGYTFHFAKSAEKIVRKILAENCAEASLNVSDKSASFQVPMEQSGAISNILEQLDSFKVELSFNASTLENVFVSLSSNPGSHFKSGDIVDTEFMVESEHISLITDTPKRETKTNCANWFVTQTKFALFVDLLRVFVQHWSFFLVFTVVFFGLPQLMMLLCYMDDVIEGSKDLFKDGNVTVTPQTLTSNPKVALFGNPPNYAVSEIEAILTDAGIGLEKDLTEEEVMHNYQSHPTEVFNLYPFLLRYNSTADRFICLVNPHFFASSALCAIVLAKFSSTDADIKGLEVALLFYPGEAGEFDYEFDGGSTNQSGVKQCRAVIYYYIAPLLYFCLLFFLIRIESLRNLINLQSFYRANGANPLFSLVVRVVGLFFLSWVFIFAVVVTTEELDYKLILAENPPYLIPNYKLLGYLTLFCITFTCFAVFIAKMINSVLVQMSLTLIIGVLYLLIYAQKSIRTNFADVSKWLNLLVYPGYVLPVGGLGFILSWDQASEKEALRSWLVQLLIYGTFILLVESLVLRLILNAVSSICNSGSNRQEEELAVDAKNVSHTYVNFDLSLLISRRPKIVKITRALRQMKMSVKKGECYALLGVNGAGKSTMFEVLTGGNRLQQGVVTVFSKSLAWNPLGVLRDVGYCSQMDKIPGYLTCRAVVELFGRLRGLGDEDLRTQIKFMTEVLDVESHMKKLVSGCSGGTKRKISTMVAFVGFPKLIILDESTTGVDPVTRMFFAKLIRAAKQRGSTVIISSHTMEECESSADTICIMTGGKPFCEDSPGKLKEEHGKFYSVTVKVNDEVKLSASSSNLAQSPSNTCGSPSDDVLKHNGETDLADRSRASFKVTLDVPQRDVPFSEDSFKRAFPQSSLQYTFTAGLYTHMFFNIPKDSVQLSSLFKTLDLMKKEGKIAECIVNTASLEQIFMQIALEDEYGKMTSKQNEVSPLV